MAYGLKYYCNFFQEIKQLTNEFRIEIHKEGYASTQYELNLGANPVIVDHGSAKMFEAIKKTTIILNLWNISEGLYSEFLTAAYGDYKIVIIQDPNGTPLTKWVAYNQSEIGQESYTAIPYASSVKWTCGLSHLNYKPFLDEDNEIEESAKDANDTATVSASFAVPSSVSTVLARIIPVSGNHSTHVITLQTSADDIVWANSAHTITGTGSFRADDITANYVRLKVTTAQGAASVVDWKINPTYSGQKSALEVIRLCLNKLGAPLPIREIINVYDVGMNTTTTDSLLNQVFVDVEVYKDAKTKNGVVVFEYWKCKKVIEAILKPFMAHIFNYGGYWYIIRIQEYDATTLYYREFNAREGDESTITIDATGSHTTAYTITGVDKGNSNELAWAGANADQEMLEPLNRVEITFKTSALDFASGNLLPYGDFKNINFDAAASATYSGYPAFWQQGPGLDMSAYSAIKSPSGLVTSGFYPPDITTQHLFRFEPTEQATATGENALLYLQYIQPSTPLVNTDTLRIGFYFEGEATFENAWGHEGWRVRDFIQTIETNHEFLVKVGDYYLVGDNLTGSVWQLTAGVFIYYHSDWGYYPAGPISGSLSYAVNIRHYATFDTPTLPETGLKRFEFRIYRQWHNVSSFVGLGQDNSTPSTASMTSFYNGYLSCSYLPQSNVSIDDIQVNGFIDEDEEILKDTFIHADGNSFLAQNAFRLSTNVLTTSWNRRGLTDNLTIMRLAVEVYRDMRGEFIRKIKGDLTGEFDFFNCLTYLVGATTTKYMLNGTKYNLSKGTYSGFLIELESFITTIAVNDIKTLNNTPDGTIETTTENNLIKEGTATQSMIVKQGSNINVDNKDLNNFL